MSNPTNKHREKIAELVTKARTVLAQIFNAAEGETNAASEMLGSPEQAVGSIVEARRKVQAHFDGLLRTVRRRCREVLNEIDIHASQRLADIGTKRESLLAFKAEVERICERGQASMEMDDGLFNEERVGVEQLLASVVARGGLQADFEASTSEIDVHIPDNIDAEVRAHGILQIDPEPPVNVQCDLQRSTIIVSWGAPMTDLMDCMLGDSNWQVGLSV